MSTPAFSVCVPVYNQERFLGFCLKSCLENCGPEDEVIVVDDGSTDRSVEIARQFADPRLRVVLQENGGAPKARNRLVAEATKEFILWNDSDDVMPPGTLESYRQAMARHPGYEVYYGNLLAIGPDNQVLHPLLFPDHTHRTAGERLRMLVNGTLIPNPGTVVRRDVYARAGGYDPAFRRAQDYELWSRIAPWARFCHMGGFANAYRIHGGHTLSGDGRHRDTHYEVEIVRRLAQRHALEELFPELPWAENRTQAELSAHYLLAAALAKWGGHAEALPHAEKSVALGATGENAALLIQCLIHLEEFKKALALCAKLERDGVTDPRLGAFALLLRRLFQPK